MIQLVRTQPSHPDLIPLIKALDEDLAITDGDEHAFYDQFNSIDDIKHMLLMYVKNTPVAIGAIKEYDDSTVEIKRMYTTPSSRNKGLASIILKELEAWAKELHFKRCILETGKRQVSAIALYKKNGYQITEKYGQYKGMENSVCFEKTL